MAITYNVYRDDEKVASGLTEKAYADIELTPNTSYEYQVSAENEYGESTKSNAVSVTTDYSDVASVTLNKNTLSLDVDATDTLTVTVDPSTAEQGLTWSSDDDTIATVDDNGLVAAIAEGEATITVASIVNPSKSDTCVVTVSRPIPDEPQGLNVTGKTDTTADLGWQ